MALLYPTFWDFGDGSTSTLENPTHTYGSSGVYLVTLTVTAVSGDICCTQTIRMKVPVEFDADWRKADAKSDVTSGEPPLIYPNPAENKLFLNLAPGLSETLRYQILDASGAVVREGKVDGETRAINIQELSGGTYILSVGMDGEVKRTNFFKE